MIYQSMDDVRNIKQEIEMLKREDEALHDRIDQCNNTLLERIQDNEDIHKQFAKDYKTGFDYTQDRI